MWKQHKRLLQLYSPWPYTLVAFLAALVPFFFKGDERLFWMKTICFMALPLGLLGFYLCFRKRHPTMRDLAVWMNLFAVGLSLVFLYIGYL